MPQDEDRADGALPEAPTGRSSRDAETPAAQAAAGSERGEAERVSPGLLPSLTLPKGGGALRGIGEKFSTNPATGTGSLSLPIATSPGRAGFELGLELSYDSGAGNGPFGIGWRLSAPSITRKTDRGLPRYEDGEDGDVFILSGSEDLVPARVDDGHGERLDAFDDGDYHVQRYRPRTEGSFTRIERWTHRATGDAHWRTITRDNLLNVYGRTSAARVTDPEHPERAFSWLLEESRDDRGNAVRYAYKAEDGAGVDPGKASEANRFERGPGGTLHFLGTAQRYLKRIQYGNRAPLMDRAVPAPADERDWLFEVVFDYGEHDAAAPTPAEDTEWSVRQDPFSSHRSTFEVRTYRLCRRILMFHRFAELGASSCLVRSTDFMYDEGPTVTYLGSATQVGYRRAPGTTQYERETLPPLELGYVKPEVHEELRVMDPASLEGIPGGIAGTGAQWVDLDGEGISGVLVPAERGWRYKHNLGGGALGPPVLERRLPAPAELRGGGQQLSDLGGDGNLDLVSYVPPLAGYFERTPDETWAPFVALPNVPAIDWNDPNLRFLDVDGDGFPDVLITEQNAFVWYRSRGKAGFEPAVFAPKPREERKGAAILFADGTETIQLADMCGDGLVDIVRVRNNEVSYWPNLGHGRFGRRVTLDASPRFDTPHQFDPKRVRFADVDGSGTNDLVYLGRDGIRIYFNQSGNGFAPARRLESLPPVDSLSNLAIVDLLGLGTACFVLSQPLPGRAPVVYAEVLGWRREDGSIEHGKKPHVLERVSNNVGGETRISYASSTKHYLRDQAAGRPWLTRLPFPVQVIERIEHHDHVAGSRLVTTFAYHHGYFDGVEREFRGFACVDQWDAESFTAEKGGGLFADVPFDTGPAGEDLKLPPVRTVTWFHTGAWLERERLELALAREYYGNDPATQDPRASELFLPDTSFELEGAGGGEPVSLSAADEREATRALRGAVLRQEIYSADGTEAAGHPYSVTERNHQVRRIQRSSGRRHGVFFSHPLDTLTLHYERVHDDPRVQHEMVLAVDAFGNVERSASIAYPRRPEARAREEASAGAALGEQERLWVGVTERSYANRPDEDGWYRTGVPVETVASELTGVAAPARGVLSHEDLLAAWRMSAEIPYEAAGADGLHRRVIERRRARYYREYGSAAEYRADPLGPLPLGEVTQRALPHQTYRQALTPGLVEQVYGAGATDAMLREEGPYVRDDEAWWAPSGRGVFDPARFFLPVEAFDAFGEAYRIGYDGYALLVRETEDPLHNRVTAGLRDAGGVITSDGNDYRVLAPVLLCDPNRNGAAVELDCLGRVVKLWHLGREGGSDGDPRELPGVLYRYDLHAWREARGPSSAHVASRLVHGAGGDAFGPDGAPNRSGFLHARSHADGSGREVMKKVQAEPGPVPVLGPDGRLARGPDGSPLMRDVEDRWVGTGRKVFDNKGNVIKSYEPFFSSTLAYEDESSLVEWGVTPIFRYDPLSRLVRIDRPNGTSSRVVLGAWRQETWDENDTVLESAWYERRGKPDPQGPEPQDEERRAAWLAARHGLTPTTAFVDALGRTFLTVVHDAWDEGGLPRRYPTRVALDIQGNQRSITDARGVRTLEQVFDVLGRAIRSEGPDAGQTRALLDAAGKPRRSWDLRGFAIRRRYDALQRHTHVFVREGLEAEALSELTLYGEGHPEAEVRNLRKRAYQAYDGSGVLTTARFDFKGNPVEISRRLTRDHRRRPDWSAIQDLPVPAAEGAASFALDPEVFSIDARFDALNRIVSRTTPDGSETLPAYDQAGLIESLRVRVRGAAAAAVAVERIRHNARGQREQIRYGNGTATRYEYDPSTFRLARLSTSRDGGDLLQDLSLVHDPVGNVVSIRDGVSFGNPGVSASGRYEYDATYQLTRSEGREHPGQQRTDEDAAELGLPAPAHPNDWQALRRYRETFRYDPVGNILEVAHRPLGAGGGGGWSRQYEYRPDSNRLSSTSLSGAEAPQRYEHDGAGNMSRMPHLAAMSWDHANRLQRVTKQVQAAEGPPNDVFFAYDGSGERVRKVYEHGGVVEDRISLGGYEVYRRRQAGAGGLLLERQTLHVMDGEKRVALVETKTSDASGGAAGSPRWRFQLDNHLGSSVMEVDDGGALISYEEYLAFGGSAFRALNPDAGVSARRYRYVGKERDEETGLGYYGARYYAGWLGRWTNCDPRGVAAEGNAYRYCRNCPVRLFDPNGADAAERSFWDRHGARIVGGLQVLGGVLEIGAGVAGMAAPTGVTQVLGGVAIVHGADTLSTGLATLLSGEVQQTLTQQGATAAARGLGASEGTAHAIGTGVDLAAGIVPSAGVGVMRAVATRGAVEAGTQTAAHAAPEVAAQTATHAAPEAAAQTATHAAPEVAAQTATHAAPEAAAQTATHAAPQAAAQTATHAAPQAAAQTATHAAPQVAAQVGRASSRALARALEAAGNIRPLRSAAHHIVAGSARLAAPARAVLQRFGIGINEATNGVFLPANRAAAAGGTAAAHSAVHTADYYRAVNQLLSRATTRQQAMAALNYIRNRLLSGGFP